jgi:branched-chain amino acid transport system ATP-binding protein
MSFLQVVNVSKNFGGLTALDRVSFSVQKGEIIGLIGANGAGKTTLFNVISGFCPPTTGVIYFKNEDITGMKPYKICKKGLVRTFQLVKPFPNMTVLQNVTVGRLFGRGSAKSIKEAMRDAYYVLEFIGLASKAEVLPTELTIADRKRLEVGRALATNPELLLLDEVLAGLNPSEISETIDLVKRINQEMGVTIMLIEHAVKAVMQLCHRIIVLHYGKKIAEGSPKEVATDKAVIDAYLGNTRKWGYID